MTPLRTAEERADRYWRLLGYGAPDHGSHFWARAQVAFALRDLERDVERVYLGPLLLRLVGFWVAVRRRFRRR